jgi:hypothetical protein
VFVFCTHFLRYRFFKSYNCYIACRASLALNCILLVRLNLNGSVLMRHFSEFKCTKAWRCPWHIFCSLAGFQRLLYVRSGEVDTLIKTLHMSTTCSRVRMRSGNFNLSALFWLSLKSKSSSFVRENKRKLPGNVSISSELVIMSEKKCCIWISSRDVIQRKFYMPTKRYHLVEFNINRKNSHLLLYMLLSGDIATNPGPANRTAKVIYVDH